MEENKGTTKTKKNIYDKLSAVQTAIKAPKNLYNSFGKYSYRNAEGILEALKPYLSENGLACTVGDELEAVGERLFVKATVTLVDVSGSGSVSVSAYAELDATHKGMTADQRTGCASSYARKYALNGMFLLDDTKDADTDEFTRQTSAGSKTDAPKTEKRDITNKSDEDWNL